MLAGWLLGIDLDQALLESEDDLALAGTSENLRVVEERDAAVEFEGQEDWVTNFEADVLRAEVVEQAVDVWLDLGRARAARFMGLAGIVVGQAVFVARLKPARLYVIGFLDLPQVERLEKLRASELNKTDWKVRSEHRYGPRRPPDS